MSGHEDEVKQWGSQHTQSIKPTSLFTFRKSAARFYPIESLLAKVDTKRLINPQYGEKTTRYKSL